MNSPVCVLESKKVLVVSTVIVPMVPSVICAHESLRPRYLKWRRGWTNTTVFGMSKTGSFWVERLCQIMVRTQHQLESVSNLPTGVVTLGALPTKIPATDHFFGGALPTKPTWYENLFGGALTTYSRSWCAFWWRGRCSSTWAWISVDNDNLNNIWITAGFDTHLIGRMRVKMIVLESIWTDDWAGNGRWSICHVVGLS